MDVGEVVEGKTSASDNKHVKFSPEVKVMSTDDIDGNEPYSEITTEMEHGSAKSSNSSDTVSSSSLMASPCEDIVQVDSQIHPDSVGENIIHLPSGGSNGLEECVEECRESISELSDVDHACLMEDISPILSPSIQVVECPEDYDPNSPAFIIDSSSPTMEGTASSDDLLFSIHIADDAISTGAELNQSGELPKSGQSFRSGELCQSGEPSKSGEIHETKDCRSSEHLKANESKSSDELGRLSRISSTSKVVEPIKTLSMEKTANVNVKRGEKGMVGEPINDVPDGLVIMNNQAETSIGYSRGTNSKHESDTTIALPKNKKSSCKSGRCSKWPSSSSKLSGCSCKRSRWPRCFLKWFICQGCFFCERPSNRLKYPRWAGRCFKCLYWPCLVCRC